MIIIDGEQYDIKFDFYYDRHVHEVVTDKEFVTLKMTTKKDGYFMMLSTTVEHSAYKAIMEKKRKFLEKQHAESLITLT